MKFLSVFFLFIISVTTQIFAQTYPVPEILYYKFNNGSTTTPNYAIPGEGTNPAVIVGAQTLGMIGQFDSALVGAGGTSTANYVNSGWNMNFGTSSWTISMWISNIGTTTCYLFGNDITTSFRCFTNGAAGVGNITLRGASAATFPNIDITGVLPGPSVVHIVYDSATTTISKYVNGVFQASVMMPALNLTAAVPFKVGGYGTANAIGQGWLMDEFRVYRRALSPAEITATWNQTLPYTITGVTSQNGEVPTEYRLSQNYPNPFNPATTINYSIPVAGNVELGIFNMLGQKVASIQNGFQTPGNYTAHFNAADLPSGVYMYRISSGSYSESRKMILVK
jgi:hypothetical protein